MRSSINLTMTEAKVFMSMMEEFFEVLGNAGCNDFKIENTPQNKIFLKNVIKHSKPSNLKEELDRIENEDSEYLYSFDIAVLNYLVDKIVKCCGFHQSKKDI